MAAEGSIEGAGMFDRLFGRRKKRARKAERQETGAREGAARTTRQEPAKEEEPPAKIRKGMYLSALIYVEGDQAPAENFSATAKAAVRQALDGEHNGLTLTLKKLEGKTDVEQEDGGKGEEKFEF